MAEVPFVGHMSLRGKQSVPKRGSVGSLYWSRPLIVTRTRRYRVSVLTVSHLGERYAKKIPRAEVGVSATGA